MSIQKVKQFFSEYGLESRIQEFKQSSATVELAANAIGCEPKNIGKTLSFKLGEKTILVVIAGDAKVDNQKYKVEFNTKAKMLSSEEVESLTGHNIGGVCPFGINEGVNVYLDISLKRFRYIYPAAGSSNSAIKLSIDELEKYSNSVRWVDICKNWE